MDLYLQMGHGMRGVATTLLGQWGGGAAILSPRDMDHTQVVAASREVHSVKGRVLIDPQCYTRDADHGRLNAHGYWKAFREIPTGDFVGKDGARAILKPLLALVKEASADALILPGLMTQKISVDWLKYHESIWTVANELAPALDCYSTIALGSEVLGDEVQVEAIIDGTEAWQVKGYYLVPEAPSNYLIEDPNWLSNLLLLVAGLRQQGREVIIGYCSHQLLCLSAANATAIASGNFVNVRTFPIDKFFEKEEGAISRRSIWYYCPQALSEYKMPFLDMAHRNKVLDKLRAVAPLEDRYSAPLFTGVQPSTVNWAEPAPFLHYLHSLRAQCREASKKTFEDSVAHHKGLLATARQVTKLLSQNQIYGQDRDFKDCIDVNVAAIDYLTKARGPVLKKYWRP